MTEVAAGTLQVESLEVDVAGRSILKGVDLEATSTSPVVLFGPNGAGKSMLLKAISGLVRTRSGRVFVGGVEVTDALPPQRRAAGIAILLQTLGLFEGGSVRDNLMVAATPADAASLRSAFRRSYLTWETEAWTRAEALLERVQLSEFADRPILSLSYGQQKLVAIVRCLLLQPRLLLADEPLAGLSPPLRRIAISLLEEFAISGGSLVVVEHDIHSLRHLDWRGIFLREGRVALSGSFTTILRNPIVGSTYLGYDAAKPEADRGAPALAPPADGATVDGILTMESTNIGYGTVPVLTAISISVRPGEVVGLVGLNGSGKSTLLHGIFGIATVSGGDVRFGGRSVLNDPPETRSRNGILYLAQGRPLFRQLTVLENLKVVARYLRPGPVTWREAVVRVLASMPSVAALQGRLVGTLSGGETQAVAAARVAVGNPRLLLLDEPSIGLSPDRLDDLVSQLEALRRAMPPIPILIAEQNLPFLRRIASRVLVLRQGRIVAELTSAALLDPMLVSESLGLGERVVAQA